MIHERVRANPSIPAAEWPSTPSPKEEGHIVIRTHHDRFCRCRGCKPPLVTSKEAA